MYEEFEHDTEEYRDSVATIGKDGKRIWLYPKKPKGRFYNARSIATIVFLAIFLTLPFITYQGEPIFLLNVLERKFILFGLLFMPQDFHLFVLAMLTFIVFIILFTVVFGRLFCGWVCPQTIFLEMIFRKIEYWIEGDANAQRRLDAADWSPEKIRKKALKHFIFFSISVVVANYFLAYIIGMKEVLKIITEPIGTHVGGFAAMIVFSYAFYGVFSRLREQVCTTICPYGRLQSVLLVPDSIVVAYDFVRGEPRGKLKKQKEAPPKETEINNPLKSIQDSVSTIEPLSKTLGDCIDCNLCVQVCPTGIDIRNGTQLECVNCTACIDACDSIMDKINKPRGLVRYTSEEAIATGKKFKVTTRIIAYSIVLTILLSTLVTLLAIRTDVEATVLRTPGMLYQDQPNGQVSNLYNVKIVNKTFHDLPIEVKVVEPSGSIKWVGQGIQTLKEQDISEGEFFLILNKSSITSAKTKIKMEIYSNGKLVETVNTNFIGPVN